ARDRPDLFRRRDRARGTARFRGGPRVSLAEGPGAHCASWYKLAHSGFPFTRAMANAETKSSIQVIDRMVKLLDVLARHAEPVGLKTLAQASSLHPSTAHRILGALVHDRLVERFDQGNYRLGIRLLELGNLVKGRISVREHALPHMRE